MIIPIGETTVKNIMPITIGEIILPKKIPNMNQSLFNGVKVFELINPNIKKTNDKVSDQYLISLPFNKGYIEINKKNTKNTIPKLLFELLFSILIKTHMLINKKKAISF
jgi:hypothetical protein